MWVKPKMVSNCTTVPLRSDLESEEKSNRLEFQVVYLAIDFMWRGSLKLKYMWTHGLVRDLEGERLEDLGQESVGEKHMMEK